MKIGIDARLYRSSAAGIGRYSQNLIKNLLDIDHENEYVLLMTKEDAEEFKTQNSKLKTTTQNLKIVVTDIEHYSLSEQLKLPKILEAEKCDLWHFLNFNVPVRFKGKFIVTIHDLTLFYYPGRSKKSFLHKLAYKYIFGQACRNALEIVAVSESTKKDIMQVFKTGDEKISVVYEAADDMKSFANEKTFQDVGQSDIEKINQDYDLGGLPLVLYVGQWRPHKNLTGLIEAFNILRQSTEAKLAIVGKVDPAFPEVAETIDKSPYLSDIIKSGFVDEKTLAAFYSRANVFVFPSFYEGFGLPGLEAMMNGLPVASSDRTSLPEIYEDAAVYFNPSDPKDIAQKVKQILKDKTLRHNLISKGYAQAHKFSWRKMAEKMLKLYQTIIK